MSRSQINHRNIDILHCSSIQNSLYKHIKYVYKTKVFYALNGDVDKFYKLNIDTLFIDYNSSDINFNIKKLIVEKHNKSIELTIDELLDQDKLATTTNYFKERIAPYIRNKKIDIINGN